MTHGQVTDAQVVAAQVADDLGAPRYSSATRARLFTMVISALVGVALVVLLAAAPTPYAIYAAGPTLDTLGDVDGEPLIQISGAPTYPTDGQLRMTTVSTFGAPGTTLGILQVVRSWANPDNQVLPREAAFPTQQSAEQREQEGQVQLSSSEENATVSALEELGYTVTARVTVAQVTDDSPSAGKIQAGDVLTSVQGQAVTSYAKLREQLAQVPAGTTLSVVVERDSQPVTVDVVTGSSDAGGSSLGLGLTLDFTYPFDVTFAIEGIGGPSAGTMLALAIIDKLTEGDMTGGAHIAGTGTIDLMGNVGVIGGIEQKLAGAHRDGAGYFLAPQGNCEGVIGHEHGMVVIPIETLHQARQAVEAIAAGKADTLPHCPAP